MEIREYQFLKSDLILANGNELYKLLLKLGEIQFLKNITTRRSLFVVGKTDFPASRNHFFSSIFQRLRSVFYRLVEKCLIQRSPSFRLAETDFLASENCFRLVRVFPPSGNRH